MFAKNAEELATVREGKRNLSMTVENLKSELGQWKSKVMYNFGIVHL